MAVKKAPINTTYLNSLLLDENFQGEIAYEQLTVGRKLGSGGFKDCYAGTYLGVRRRWFCGHLCLTSESWLRFCLTFSFALIRKRSQSESCEFKTLQRWTSQRWSTRSTFWSKIQILAALSVRVCFRVSHRTHQHSRLSFFFCCPFLPFLDLQATSTWEHYPVYWRVHEHQASLHCHWYGITKNMGIMDQKTRFDPCSLSIN